MRLSSHTDNIPPRAWDDFVEKEPSGHLLQTWAWGDFKSRFGWRALRVAVEDGGKIVAAAQVLLRRLPLGTLAYVPKGPVGDPKDRSVFHELMDALHRAVRRYRPIFLKIEPDWPDAPERRQQLQELGFRPSLQTIQPRHTLLVDLTADEDTVLEAMKSKTRYNIRLASRKGVTVREGDDADLADFYRLMETTGDRDEFGVHSREYYETVWSLFAPSGRVKLFLATYEGMTLAALMAFALGRKAWYMYGASANEHRNLMPNHLLQWEAMRWAKAKGCLTYDLWGIPDMDIAVLEAAAQADTPPCFPPPPLWGVYRFKRGFGGQAVRYIGAYDYPYQPLLYRLVTWLWRKRKEIGG